MSKVNNILLTVFMIVVLLLSMVAFAEAGSFIIAGLTDEDIKVTVNDLKELPTVKKDVTSIDSSGDKDYYTVTGALFSDLLESKGESQDDLKAIRLIAGDGYSIEVPEPVLSQRKIILAYKINGKPLPEKTKPVRVVILEERAMYWVKNLKKINVIDMIKTINIDSLVFLETVVSGVKKVNYTYYESKDKAVKVSKLLKSMGLKTDKRTVAFRAADGYTKDEKINIFKDGYIKVTGDHAPMFLSPDLPKGMYVKDLLFTGYGSTSICSLKQALKVFETAAINGIEGVKLSRLVAESGLIEADKYKISAIDGYSVEVRASNMEKGIAYVDNKKDRLRCSFAELSKKYSVKYLYKIEPMK